MSSTNDQGIGNYDMGDSWYFSIYRKYIKDSWFYSNRL